ncbi:MAG: chalcone isomerase family protein [Burkholderiales bacterium]|nr:chalcone isomerase family protein [Burkholderiales bacterium]
MTLSKSLRFALASCAMVCSFVASVPALAANTSTKFEPVTEVRGAKLQLNGAGTRYKAIFKVYDMALYTTRKVSTPEELLALPGPKRLQFTALRDIPGTDLGRLFMKGLSENSHKDQVQRHAPSTTRFIEIFSAKSKLVAGDTFAMEYTPGKGTQFYILGQPQGEPVGDDEFFTMVMNIWVGDSPADRGLKASLLGNDK